MVKAGDYRDRPGNQRVLLEEYSRERGPILVGPNPVARSKETGDTLKYLRVYSDGPAVRPGHRLLLARLRRHRPRAHREPDPHRQVQPVRRRPDRAAVRRPRSRSAVRSARRSTPARRRPPSTGWRARRAPSSRSSQRPGASWRRSSSRRSTPTSCPATTPRRSAPTTRSSRPIPTKPLLNRPIVSLEPAGLDVQARHRRGRPGVGTLHPGLGPARPGDLPAARTPRRRSATGTARSAGPNGLVTLREALAISCNTAFAWLGNELGDDALRTQAELMGFDHAFQIPLRAATSTLPRGSRRAADRDVGHRPVRRAGDRAADGDGRGGHRQQRRDDESLPRPGGPRPRPRDPPDHASRRRSSRR